MKSWFQIALRLPEYMIMWPENWFTCSNSHVSWMAALFFLKRVHFNENLDRHFKSQLSNLDSRSKWIRAPVTMTDRYYGLLVWNADKRAINPYTKTINFLRTWAKFKKNSWSLLRCVSPGNSGSDPPCSFFHFWYALKSKFTKYKN